jgi:TPR repeat protein
MDYRAAFEQLITAADAGNDGYALYNLGIMYLKGWYVARDPRQALHYFKRALERGVGAAANAIGVLAAHGEALPGDFTAAARWFEKGANMSDTDSIFNMGTLYLHGAPGWVVLWGGNWGLHMGRRRGVTLPRQHGG